MYIVTDAGLCMSRSQNPSCLHHVVVISHSQFHSALLATDRFKSLPYLSASAARMFCHLISYSRLTLEAVSIFKINLHLVDTIRSIYSIKPQRA